MVTFLIAVRLYARKGRALRGRIQIRMDGAQSSVPKTLQNRAHVTMVLTCPGKLYRLKLGFSRNFPTLWQENGKWEPHRCTRTYIQSMWSDWGPEQTSC
jgi:hypothetical protein